MISFIQARYGNLSIGAEQCRLFSEIKITFFGAKPNSMGIISNGTINIHGYQVTNQTINRRSKDRKITLLYSIIQHGVDLPRQHWQEIIECTFKIQSIGKSARK